MSALSPEKQFDLAKDSITQVITLSSAILAISLTFSKNWASTVTSGQKTLLEISWILFLVSILAGLAALLAITGQVGTGGTLRDLTVRVPWLAQLICFLLALIVFAIFGFRVL
jgi:hypothetical protein